MKYAEINLNSNKLVTTKDVADRIIKLVANVLDKNSHIGKVLNATSKTFNPNFAMDFPILDGFSNAKETANKLTQYTPEQLLSNGFSREDINYYFGYDQVEGKLKINSNTISLVSGLSSIITLGNTTGPTKADLITEDFIRLFLPKNDKEKANIMLTLGQTTLKTLSGGANYILDNIGISSVIMSPFTAVTNAPALL
jgi:hypothetical protein